MIILFVYLFRQMLESAPKKIICKYCFKYYLYNMRFGDSVENDF